MKAEPFDTGIVTISLDTELGWARVNSGKFDDIEDRLDEGRTGIRRLLDAFGEYDIPATWAIVGQLLDPKEPTAEIEELPTIASDIPWDRDWWRMPSLVEEIQSANVNHEIGCHSGSHLLYDQLSPAQAEEDLVLFENFASQHVETDPSAFVFPQNQIGNVPVLAEHDFTCYRGVPPQGSSAPSPSTFLPRSQGNLQNIPQSAGYRHFRGRNPLLRYAPERLKVLGLRLGVSRAARNGGVYHVVLHPKDFALDDGEQLLCGFMSWLAVVKSLRERGRIQTLTMSDVSRRCSL